MEMEFNTGQKVYTVSDLTRDIKDALEKNPYLSSVWLKGEISNLTYHSSGHIYFSLKDENSLISATFFRFANKGLKFRLEEGMSVFAFGGVTVFEKRGSCQFNVAAVRLEGEGELQKRIEQLKKKLTAEGVFDQARKRPLPFLPKRIGIVTSPTGAALRDIIKVALRRYPNIEIVLAPAKVQGDGAAETIVRGIKELNRPEHRIDVIIAGRGGGSFEDLMPFNEEPVVRAFYSSRLPIVSAVGHQIDHPLCDDAADMAAPTPSAAAEMVVPLKQELFDEINYHIQRSLAGLENRARAMKIRLRGIMDRRIFREPQEIVNARELLIADLENRITASLKEAISMKRRGLMALPDISLVMANQMNLKNHRFHMALQSLENLSPLNVMKRGYAIAMDKKKALIKNIDDTEQGDRISLHLADGSLQCLVESKRRGDIFGKETETR
jgi:exodeoxyribonuclease VII large subunit